MWNAGRLTVTDVKQTAVACPTQWEARTIGDARPVCIRYRSNKLTVQVGPPGGDIESAIRRGDIFYADDYHEKGTRLDWLGVRALTGLMELSAAPNDLDFDIYHYCSTEAFLNIIQSRTLRIGYAKFMNDPKEMIFSGPLIEKCLARYPETADIASKAACFDNAFYPYVCCFSKRADIDEQWCRYADGGHGVAIRFDPNSFRLSEFAFPHPGLVGSPNPDLRFGLATVIYDEAQQETLIEDAIRSCLQNPIDEYRLAVILQRAAYRIKDPGFSPEEEIRVILEPGLVTDPRSRLAHLALQTLADLAYDTGVNHPLLRPEVRFRTTRHQVLPYYEFDLAPRDIMPIRSVILGPRNDSEIGAIELLLSRLEYGDVTVVRY